MLQSNNPASEPSWTAPVGASFTKEQRPPEGAFPPLGLKGAWPLSLLFGLNPESSWALEVCLPSRPERRFRGRLGKAEAEGLPG